MKIKKKLENEKKRMLRKWGKKSNSLLNKEINLSANIKFICVTI